MLDAPRPGFRVQDDALGCAGPRADRNEKFSSPLLLPLVTGNIISLTRQKIKIMQHSYDVKKTAKTFKFGLLWLSCR